MTKKRQFLNVLIVLLLLAVGVGAFLVSRGRSSNVPELSIVQEEVPQIVIPEPTIEPLFYSSITLVTDKPGKEVTDAVGFENLDTVLSLNRIDQKHFQKGQLIVYPSRFGDMYSLSSFPRNIPELAQVPKMIFIAQEIQEFGAYEYGTLVRFGGISTGKKSTPTTNKLFFTNWKGKEVVSTSNDEWILKWNFNIDNLDGIGIHEYELPGYPASHSCIRFSASDALWFYDWADQWVLSDDGNTVIQNGTPVLVFGSYDYGATAPWKKLPEDPYAMTLRPQDISEALSPHLSELVSQI